MPLSKEKLEQQKQDRLGEINYNKFGTPMKIVEYEDSRNIIVEFQDKYKTKIKTKYIYFKNGGVKNPYDKETCNIGYHGVGKYKGYIKGKCTKAYQSWNDMLIRCYDPYYLNKYPSYINCYVCKEWHNFQNFAEWYEENYYECNGERMCLDKDILVKGNKIYSPETCVIVPNRINVLFTKKQNHRGKYPIGVTYIKRDDKLSVCCNIFDKEKQKPKSKFLGHFPTSKPFQAFYAYKIFKENYIKQVADEYKDFIPKKLYDALYKYEVEIND